MNTDYDEEILDEFWGWIGERQRIFKKKHLLGQDPPWTDDEVLQDKHFTNVYRELDRVTREYIDSTVGQGHDPEDVAFTTFMWRIFNRGDTMEVVGVHDPHDYSPEEVYEPIDDAQDEGRLSTTFNGAYMITGAVGESGERKHKSYAEVCFGDISERWEHYWPVIGMSDGRLNFSVSPGELTQRWTEIPGVSDFIAYEVFTDLTYHEWFPFDENDYVNPGPGAKRGIKRLLGVYNSDEDPDINFVEHIEYLRGLQDENLPDDFEHWIDDDISKDSGRLTLRAIEHCLCEFDKYRRYKESGGSAPLKNHSPRDEPLGIEDEVHKSDSQMTAEDFL